MLNCVERRVAKVLIPQGVELESAVEKVPFLGLYVDVTAFLSFGSVMMNWRDHVMYRGEPYFVLESRSDGVTHGFTSDRAANKRVRDILAECANLNDGWIQYSDVPEVDAGREVYSTRLLIPMSAENIDLMTQGELTHRLFDELLAQQAA